MSVDRFTLDTNILIYSIDATAGSRHEIAIQIIEQSVGLASCLTLQSVSEFFAAATRKGRVSCGRAADMARAWLNMFPIVCASADAVRLALEHVLAERASYWDGLLGGVADRGRGWVGRSDSLQPADAGSGHNHHRGVTIRRSARRPGNGPVARRYTAPHKAYSLTAR